MKLRVIAFIGLGCAGAFGFGVLANACFDMILPPAVHAAAAVPAARPVLAEARVAPAPELMVRDADLVGTTDIRPLKVKTVPIALASPDPVMAQIPAVIPQPRPATAPQANPVDAAKPATRQPSAALTPKPVRAAESDEILSVGQIDRIKTALALTPEQEAYWPAIAAELRTIAKQQPKNAAAKGHPPKLALDQDTVQRLYWAAAPLITRLSEEQKRKARELALIMGLQEVAQAL